MKRIFAIALLGLSLGGCQQWTNLLGTINSASTTTVSPIDVNIAINSYEALKATAVGYANSCIKLAFPRPVCSAANRRAVIRYIKAGDGAVAVLVPALNGSAPLLSTTYNALIAASAGLKAAPITQVQG